MKKLFTLAIIVLFTASSWSQVEPVKPSLIRTGTYYGLTPPLRDLPVLTEAEYREMEANAGIERNPELENRSYPFAATALPKGPDPAWQRKMGTTRTGKNPILNFNGQISPYYPPDANGAVGPLYYFQMINTVYAIYDKTDGSLVAGPTNVNQLFSGVTGSSCNDGDPLILFDEQANRWLAAELSICESNNRMLIAVSQTSDPTGSWYKYSFDVDDMPDYEKFGIWQDGYYMGTNTEPGNDIYVFERSQMLNGGTAQMVGFDNPWRPTSIDGFMCIPPVDNDGAYAPEGEPGLFITINDDAIAGGSDQLWIYELSVNWATPANSTFVRSQQLDVPAFDSNFGYTWDNIVQPNTNQKLDAIPMIIMNRPQYRNFGAYETIVCCHTVDLDATNHAGIRWYELRRSGADWSIRQSGTYGPDADSRWMGAVSLNGNNEIGLAYSVSSSTVYPSIRYCGQSSSEYEAGSGLLDVEESVIQTGNFSQFIYNRWGDYADLSVDPDNDHTFWFTSEYIGDGNSRQTKIATFEFTPAALAAHFTSSDPAPCEGDSVDFTDQSSGAPISWDWTFEGGTPPFSTLENPRIVYDLAGIYDVRLIVSDGTTSDTLLQTDFITVTAIPSQPAMPSGPPDVCSGDQNIEYFTFTVPGANLYQWTVNPPEAAYFTGSDTVGILNVAGYFAGSMFLRVSAANDCGTSNYSDSLLVDVHPRPVLYSMVPDGGYCAGSEGFEVTLDGSQTVAAYELFRNDTTTGIILSGTGEPLSFGFQSAPGIYKITAHSFTCSAGMNDSTNVYLFPALEPAATPAGSSEECNTNMGTEYMTSGVEGALSYIWQLVPSEAGVISGDSTTGSVNWNQVFSGPVSIMVQGVDNCGPGPFSEGFDVTVYDCTGITEKVQGRVFIYPNPVENELTLKCKVGENGIVLLKIYNSFGNEVVNQSINAANDEIVTTISTASMKAGVYSVKLTSPNGKLYSGKFLRIK